MKVIIIDGYNMLNLKTKGGRKKTLEVLRNDLIRRCSLYFLSKKEEIERIIIVFDGDPSIKGKFESHHFDGVFVEFSNGIDSADEVIINKARFLIRENFNCEVVSDDREIVSNCKALGCSILSCSEFQKKLKKRWKNKKIRKSDENLNTKVQLTQSEIETITEELKKIWLND